MLAALGFATIALFLAAILTKRLSVLVALILIPAIAGVLGGFGPELGKMMVDGIVKVAPVGVMIIFAVLYFGMMLDVGLFDPMIRKLLRLAKDDPVRLALATAVLTMAVALDGDGATTFLITVSAMLPIYLRLGMSRLVLSGIVALGAGVMNMLPWGGPTARAMAVLGVESTAIFNPLVPAMVAGIIWVLFSAYILGRRERKRLGWAGIGSVSAVAAGKDGANDVLEERNDEGKIALQKPWLFWFDVGLTAVLIIALLNAVLPLPVLFVLGFAIALPVNYPSWKAQQEHLVAHASSVVTVSTMIFAAGIFTGVLTGTGMIQAMAAAMVSVIPETLSNYLPLIVAVASMPLSLVFTPDAFYFGVLPVLAQSAASFGIDPVMIGRSAVLGQMTTGFPLSPLTASTFILIGLSGVSLGEHQRFIFLWAFGTTLVMTVVALLTGAIVI